MSFILRMEGAEFIILGFQLLHRPLVFSGGVCYLVVNDFVDRLNVSLLISNDSTKVCLVDCEILLQVTMQGLIRLNKSLI